MGDREDARDIESVLARCEELISSGQVSFLHAKASAEETVASTLQVRAPGAGGGVRHGNQGAVIPVEDETGSRTLALKLYASYDDAQWEHRLLRTFSDCQVIPEVYDIGFATVDGEMIPAVLMEYIEGPSLADLMRDDEGCFPPAQAVEMAFPLLKFLALVSDPRTSRALMAHRDIKPANIIVDADERCLRLIDFGKAVTAEDAVRRGGSNLYLAPCCQAKFADFDWGDENDARVDSYSVGALLLAMVRGENALRRAREREGFDELQAGSGAPFELTGGLDAHVRETFVAQAWQRFAFDDAEVLGKAFAVARERLGYEFFRVVASCLASRLNGHEQKDRPTPSELEILLARFSGDRHVESTLSDYATEALARLIAASKLDGAWEANLQGYARARTASSPIEAVDLFNSGRYARATPLLRAFSDISPSAAYYLAICYRDGYADAADGHSIADVLSLLSAAAHRGNVMAQFNLGANLYDGVIYDAARQRSLCDIESMRNRGKGRYWVLRAASGAAGKQPLGLAREWLDAHRAPLDAGDAYWAVLEEAFELCARAASGETHPRLAEAACCLDIMDGTRAEAVPDEIGACLDLIAQADDDYRPALWNAPWMREIARIVKERSDNDALLASLCEAGI